MTPLGRLIRVHQTSNSHGQMAARASRMRCASRSLYLTSPGLGGRNANCDFACVGGMEQLKQPMRAVNARFTWQSKRNEASARFERRDACTPKQVSLPRFPTEHQQVSRDSDVTCSLGNSYPPWSSYGQYINPRFTLQWFAGVRGKWLRLPSQIKIRRAPIAPFTLLSG